MTDINHHFTVVVPTVKDFGHESIRYIWNYGDFTIIARFSGDVLSEIWIRDSKGSDLTHFWTEGTSSYTDFDCAKLISGIKELVDSALCDILYRRRCEIKGIEAALKVVNAK